MPRPNVKTVAGVYEALKRKDSEAIAAACRIDIQVYQSNELPWGGLYAGIGEAMTFFQNVMSHLDSHVTIGQILDADDHVLVVGRTAGTAKSTGKNFDVPLVHLWRLKENQVALLQVFLDNASLLPALAQEWEAAAK